MENLTEAYITTCLQAEAMKSQTSWEYVLKLYALEGMIRRGAIHPKAHEVITRGSLITRAWAYPHYRPVDDVDFLMDYPIDSERGIGFIREMLAYDLGDFIEYDLDKIEVVPTWVETPLPGERIFVPAKALGQDFLLQIDLAYNDPLLPPAVVWSYPCLVPEWKTNIHTITPELALAWKVHGLFEFIGKGSTAWDMKDLYDIYLIISNCLINDLIFADALQMAFQDRRTPMHVYRRVLEGTFGQSKGTLKGWEKFVLKRQNRLLVANHFELLEKVRAFLDKFFIPFCKE
jgi:hypothetical protein